MQTPKLQLQINAEHPLELSALVNGLAAQMVARVQEIKKAEEVKTEVVEKVKDEPVEAPKKEKKKRTVETAVTEQAVEEVKTEETPVTETSTPITKEEIAQALQGVSEKVNFQKAKEILTSFKNAEGNPCKKVSDVQASDYVSFMAACKAAI